MGVKKACFPKVVRVQSLLGMKPWGFLGSLSKPVRKVVEKKVYGFKGVGVDVDLGVRW